MNRVELIGNLGADPEVRLVGETSQVATVSIATDESYKNDAGEWVSNPEWVNLEGWGNVCEKMASMKKGQRVLVRGKLRTKSYEKDGQKKYRTVVNVQKIHKIEI